MQQIIYTVGHSTHSIEAFIAMLKSFGIDMLADIRSMPGSKRFPQFNKEELSARLHEAGIQYLHFPELGGKRAQAGVSKVAGGKPFGNYEAHMQTKIFKTAIGQLEILAQNKKVAYMCAELLWWKCHRSMVSDYLKEAGWTVQHIMGAGKTTGTFPS